MRTPNSDPKGYVLDDLALGRGGRLLKYSQSRHVWPPSGCHMGGMGRREFCFDFARAVPHEQTCAPRRPCSAARPAASPQVHHLPMRRRSTPPRQPDASGRSRWRPGRGQRRARSSSMPPGVRTPVLRARGTRHGPGGSGDRFAGAPRLRSGAPGALLLECRGERCPPHHSSRRRGRGGSGRASPRPSAPAM